MNKIEAFKQEKNGLDVKDDLPRYAQEGWRPSPTGTRSGSSGWASFSGARPPAVL